MSGFLDLKASDLVGAYLKDREIEKRDRIGEAAKTTATPTVVEQRSDPSANASDSTSKRISSNRDLWKWVGIGSAALLVGAVAWKVASK